LWAIRLTTNWSVYWGGLHHEDWRYPIVRARAGKAALWADLFRHPPVPHGAGVPRLLPVYAVMSRPDAPLGWFDALAFAVTLGAIAIEPSPTCSCTLYRHAPARHLHQQRPVELVAPSQLFRRAELLVGPDAVRPGRGAGAVVVDRARRPGHERMFLFASIPLMDTRSVERRPAYREHMRKVSALLRCRRAAGEPLGVDMDKQWNRFFAFVLRDGLIILLAVALWMATLNLGKRMTCWRLRCMPPPRCSPCSSPTCCTSGDT